MRVPRARETNGLPSLPLRLVVSVLVRWHKEGLNEESDNRCLTSSICMMTLAAWKRSFCSSVGKPKLRLNSRHTFGQFLIRIGFFGIEQMPKRDMADFAAALSEIVHREPPHRLSVLLLDRNTHSLEQGAT